jgi:hypothetical protein
LLEASLELHYSPSVADDEKEQLTKIEEPPTTFSSPVKQSILWPKNRATQSTLKPTNPPPKAAASITPLSSMHGKVVADFTTEELSAFLAFLRQEKTAAHSGQGTCHPNSATGSTTTNSREYLLTLHCNNQCLT